jgi:hypothetical protein
MLIERGHINILEYPWSMYLATVKHVEAESKR